MDPRLLSYGSSSRSLTSLTLSRNTSDISTDSTSPLLPAIDVDRGEPPTKARYKIPAPIDQFFKGAELGKWLLTLDGGALLALIGFHPESALLSKHYVGPMVVLLMIGFCALFTGLLFQESCPEFAVVAVLVGATCVVATFLTMIAAILPVNLDPVVWAVAGPMAVLLVALLWLIALKGMRERIVDTDVKLD